MYTNFYYVIRLKNKFRNALHSFFTAFGRRDHRLSLRRFLATFQESHRRGRP
jgi:hypothetical protein